MDFSEARPAVGVGRRIYIETYGCQMNVVDSETVMAIMAAEGFGRAEGVGDADVVLLNTCSIREGAEQRIWHRLDELAALKKRRRSGMVLGLILRKSIKYIKIKNCTYLIKFNGFKDIAFM